VPGPSRSDRRQTSLPLALLLAGTLVLAGCGGGKTTTTVTVQSSPAPLAHATSAAGVQAQYVAVVKATQPEVVQIQTDIGLGSGVIFDNQGDIVTNNHVVTGAKKFQVTLADGHQFSARLVGTYPPDDLAVITIGAGHGLKPAKFADSSKLSTGDIVLAVGNPLGLQSSVTDGIISALGRNVPESAGVVLPNLIQTSAAINPGNSGGALIDLQAQVVGIPTLAAENPEASSVAAGIGFAIPSSTVTDIAGQIARYGHVVNSHRAALGVDVTDSASTQGAVVVKVQPGGPAASAGITAGDAIVKVGNTDIAGVADLTTALAGYKPGEEVQVTVTGTDGSTRTMTVRLGQLPGT
jgi:S1-C subfamily serine protease